MPRVMVRRIIEITGEEADVRKHFERTFCTEEQGVCIPNSLSFYEHKRQWFVCLDPADPATSSPQEAPDAQHD